jgi:hypothetical protein
VFDDIQWVVVRGQSGVATEIDQRYSVVGPAVPVPRLFGGVQDSVREGGFFRHY